MVDQTEPTPDPSEESSASGIEHADAPFPGKGFQIDEFTVQETLGQGSMATVYLAHDDSGHEVALKIFQEGPGVSQTMLERFRREAQATKKLRKHPNIITVYKTGQQGPYHYIAMQVVEGAGTLGQWMESTTVPPQYLIRILIKITKALQYAHSRGIVHRDIKPANIMIDEFGEPLLTDFGVASLTDLPSFTLSGALTGTPLYMSPEQARGDPVGPETDIYSMGVVLFEVMTGSLPHGCDRTIPVKDVIDTILQDPPRRPRTYRRDISPDLEAIIMKCLEPEPACRYVDAEALALDLRRYLNRKPVLAHRFGILDRIRFFIRKRGLELSVIVIVLLAALSVRMWFVSKVEEAEAESLLNYALRVNAAIERREMTENQGLQTPQVWQEIRRGRNLMISGDWRSASRTFQTASDRSLQMGDRRTMGTARLEQARCEVLLENRRLAMDLYRWVVEQSDVTAVVRDQAQLEFLQLAILAEDPDQAMKVLLWHDPPDDGPIRDALDVLTGNLPPHQFTEKIRTYPQSFRNDAGFSAGLRYYSNQDYSNAEKLLRRALRDSSPSTEWPAPLVRKTFKPLTGEDQ